MIFITGGQAQGKTEFAYSFFQDKDIAAADGRCSGYGEALEAELILHLECYVLRLMQEGTDPAVFAGELIEKNGGAVVVADEIRLRKSFRLTLCAGIQGEGRPCLPENRRFFG